MDREKTERFTNNNNGRVPGRKQQNNRQSGYDSDDGRGHGGEVGGARQIRSEFELGSDSYDDQILSFEEPGNRQLSSRSRSVSGSSPCSGHMLGQEKLHGNGHLLSRSRSVMGSDNYRDQWLGLKETGRRHFRLGSNSSSDSGSNNGKLLSVEERDEKQINLRSSPLSVSFSDESLTSDDEEHCKTYTYSSESFISLSDSDTGQFSDREEQVKGQRHSTTNSKSGFRFHSRGTALHQDNSDEDEIKEDIEGHARKRRDSLSNRNQIASVKSAVVTESLLYDRQKSRRPSGDFKQTDVISVSHFPVDSNKKVKTRLYVSRGRKTIDSPSTTTAPLLQSEQYESNEDEKSALPYPKYQNENPGPSNDTTDKTKAGDGARTNRIVFPEKTTPNFKAGTDTKTRCVENLPNINKSSPEICKSHAVPHYGNQRKTTARLDQMENFVTLRESIVLQKREEEVHPKVAVPKPVRPEIKSSQHDLKTQTLSQKPNCHDLALFEKFYLLSQDNRIIKKCRDTDKNLRWLQLNGAGQMSRIGSGTIVAVVQTTVGIICLQADPTLVILYKIGANRQYLSICHLFTFQFTNDSRPSNRHSFAVTCTERREDNGNLDEQILLVKPSDSQIRPAFYSEIASKLKTPSLSGICCIHFIRKTHLVVGCRDHVAFMLFSNLSILWVCKLDRSPTDVAFWDPVILLCVPDEYKVKAIDLESGTVVNDNVLGSTDDQGWMPHRISVYGNSFLIKLYSRDHRKEVKIVEYTRDENQAELIRCERCFYN